jgi:hypothetical protein
MNIEKKDIFKDYGLFNIILLIWISAIPFKNAIYQGSTILIILVFIYHIVRYNTVEKLKTIIALYKDVLFVMMLIVGSMFLSSIFGINVLDSLSDTLKFIYRYILIFVILIYFYQYEYFSRFWMLVIIMGVLSIHSFNGVYQYFVGYDLFLGSAPDGPTYLLSGALFQHNPFGFLMAIGSSILYYLLINNKSYISIKYEKLIYLVLFFSFVFTLLHSQSRSAWVMFGVFSIICTIEYIKNNGFDKKLKLIFISVVVILIVLVIFDKNLQHRLLQLLSGYSANRADVIWPFTIKHILDYPFLGHGIDTYVMLKEHKFQGVHNMILEILLYLGSVGLIVYIYSLGKIIKDGLKLDTNVYFAFLVSFLVLLLFDGSIINSKLDLSILTIIMFFIYSYRIDKINKNRIM